MKITSAMVRNIRKAVNAIRPGRIIEVGVRGWEGMSDRAGENYLLWGPGNDLEYTELVQFIAGREIDDFHGFVALDLYLYTFGENGELDTNAYVVLDPSGEVIYATDDDIGSRKGTREALAKRGVKWNNEN